MNAGDCPPDQMPCTDPSASKEANGDSNRQFGSPRVAPASIESPSNTPHTPPEAESTQNEPDDNEEVASISDEQYFAQLDADELAAYQSEGPSPESVAERVMTCTACFKQVTNCQGNNVQRHPCLGVPVCRACKVFYHEGEWTKDEDGSDLFCRWCANGGDLSLCDHCNAAFCKRCIQRNLGRKYVSQMSSESQWRCFLCQPKPIFKLRAEYYAASQWLALLKVKGKSKKKKEPDATPKTKAKRSAAQGQAQAILSHPENFIDESLKNAFMASEALHKALDEERRRWLRSKKSMKLDNVRTTIKNLRRSFHATQYNVDALDRMLLSDYHEAHPDEEFTSVRIGKITSQSNLIPEPLKGKASGALTKTESPVVKTTPTGKRKKSSTVRQNGTTIKSEEKSTLVEPPTKAKKAKSVPSPAAAAAAAPTSSSSIRTKPGEYKVSLSLFAAKKKNKNRKPAKSDSDDEIDIDINQ